MWPWRKSKPSAAELEPPRSAILPRVRNVADVQRLLDAVRRESDVVPVDPLVGELVVAYAFDRPDVYQYVALRDLARLGLEQRALRELAVENLTRICSRNLLVKDADGLLLIEPPEGVGASVMLLPVVWNAVREQVGTDLVVAVPSGAEVYACSIDDVEKVSLMAELAAMEPREGDPPPLSSELFVWCGAWEPLDEPDA